MSCAWGTLIRRECTTLDPVEALFEGAELDGPGDQSPVSVVEPLQRMIAECLRVKTEHGDELTCTPSHALMTGPESAVVAKESLGQYLCTRKGSSRVVGVTHAGPQRIIRLRIWPEKFYESNGIYSSE